MKEFFIKRLLELSDNAIETNEPPVSAIVVKNNMIVSESYNLRNSSNKTIDHAEIIAISKANVKLSTWRLNNCVMYVTIKPCEMCMSVIKESRISKIYYLLDRPGEKKQYNKTELIKLEEVSFDKYINQYKKKNTNFWKMIRKNK